MTMLKLKASASATNSQPEHLDGSNADKVQREALRE